MRYSGKILLLILGTIGVIGVGAGVFWLSPYLQYWQFLERSDAYENRELRFSFRFPKAWDFVPELDLQYKNEKFIVGVHRPQEPSTSAGVIVTKRDSSQRFDYKVFVKALEKQLSTGLVEFKPLQIKTTTRQGYPGVEISYTHKHANKVYVRQKQLIVVASNSTYYLSSASLISNYDRRKKELDNIFQSFTILQ